MVVRNMELYPGQLLERIAAPVLIKVEKSKFSLLACFQYKREEGITIGIILRS